MAYLLTANDTHYPCHKKSDGCVDEIHVASFQEMICHNYSLQGIMVQNVWKRVCQKQIWRAGINNYIPRILWDVIIYSCPSYLLFPAINACCWHTSLHTLISSIFVVLTIVSGRLHTVLRFPSITLRFHNDRDNSASRQHLLDWKPYAFLNIQYCASRLYWAS